MHKNYLTMKIIKISALNHGIFRDVPGPEKSKTRVRVSNFKFRGSGS